MNVQHKAAILI